MKPLDLQQGNDALLSDARHACRNHRQKAAHPAQKPDAGRGAAESFDVEAQGGQLILTPVRIQRGDVSSAFRSLWACFAAWR